MRGLAAALLLAGCTTEDTAVTAPPCVARIDCPNELSPPLGGACGDAALDPDCGAPYRSYFGCRQQNQVCSGSGKLDEDASVARCSNELDAYVQCLGPTVSDAAADSTVVDTSVADTGVDATPDTRSDATDAKLGG